MSWADGVLFSFDCETTGVSVFDDRIVSAAMVKAQAGEVVAKRTWLIAPGVDIPAAATQFHGITSEHARVHGRPPSLAVEEIAGTVAQVLRSGSPLVIFNAAYDATLLEVECRRHGVATVTERLSVPEQWHVVVDPCVLGRYLDTRARRQKGRTYRLPELCERYKVTFTETHDATADATGAALLAVAVAKSDDGIAGLGPKALHTLQKTARRTRQHNLKAYFDREGIEYDDVDAGWPLHTRLTAVAA